MDVDVVVAKKKNTHLFEKISRFRIIVFIQRYVLLFSFLLLLFLSMLMGLWNIKNYEVYDSQGSEIEEKISVMITSYIEKNVLGLNFFKFDSTKLARDMANEIPYVNSVRVEKVVPNRLVFFVKLFSPKMIAELKGGNCFLLSDRGYVLEELCKADESSCCKNKSEELSLAYFLSSDVDISELDNSKKKLLVMEDIYKVVKSLEMYNYVLKNISFRENILKVGTEEGKLFVFTFSSDLDVQLERLVVVMGKIRGDDLDFKSLDLRFERPVMKN